MPRLAQIFARLSVGTLVGIAAIFNITACSALPFPNMAAKQNCPKAHDLNEAWANLLIESGTGLTPEDFTSPDSSPFTLGGLNDVKVKELREVVSEACVYALQHDAIGYDGASGVLIYSTKPVDRSKVDAVLKANGWRSETTVKSPKQDQSWSHSLCGSATEMTRIVQGRPELIGGFVEVFSKQLEAALPNAQFALAMTFPASCD
ncbi:hypothetical protein QBL02_06390 [Leucobacter sp. UT-8R-CII-1-4]|uniref:hypothetical protein n=1 Tax=Leucobacter sp. UT-8R-CII-1-4 TaxID=3040075 RepID=UPI0024A92D88|nr:hypothetical protein [Leucobacter sp. UT-8R-CII-1-4]MDI6023170.1 hypothetical protein [Leucobacter sp. UT-8R-CII-1-4]